MYYVAPSLTGSGRVHHKYFVIKPELNDILLDHNLNQMVEGPTRGRNILHLLLSNNDSLVQHTVGKPGISDPDYVEILCNSKPQLLNAVCSGGTKQT